MAGRHWSATRRTTFCSRCSASCPFGAADLDRRSRRTRRRAPGRREAGIETTSSAPGTVLTASVRVWAKVNWVSNVPPRRSSSAVQLAGVGDPLVDQDQARRVLREQRRAAPRPGWSGPVGVGDQRRTPSGPPSCQASSPQSVCTSVPSALTVGRPGVEVVAHERDPSHRRRAASSPRPTSSCTSCGKSSSGVPENRWYRASIEWVLPPPKLVCRLMTGWRSSSPPIRRDRPVEQVAQTLGQVGAAEELDRVGVLVRSPSPPWATMCRSAANSDGGEVARAHIVVRRDHLAPRLETLAGDDRAPRPSPRASCGSALELPPAACRPAADEPRRPGPERRPPGSSRSMVSSAR